MPRTRPLIVAAALCASAWALPSTASAVGDTYVVRSGDGLIAIAEKNGVPLSALLAANDLELTSVILPGQKLTIPGGSDSTAPASPPATQSVSGVATYRVVPGDSLSGIAARHGVSLTSLLSANDLEITSIILPGQVLDLPAGAASPTRTAATPTSASTTSSKPGANDLSHTVVSGDSLSGVAARYGVSLNSLLAANDLEITSVIHPGQVLGLPAGAAPPVGSTPPAGAASPTPSPAPTPVATSGTHVIAWGDTLGGIASHYGVKLAELLNANGLTVSSLILPGHVLDLPVAATAPTAAAPTPAPAAAAQPATASTGAAAVVDYALAQQGKEYQFFTAGPDTFDCSGLTKAAYREVGVTLPHHSASQAKRGRAVDFRNEPIQPGDLVFLSLRGSESINHVGIAIDANTWIHATSPGDVVKVGSMPSTGDITEVRRYVND